MPRPIQPRENGPHPIAQELRKLRKAARMSLNAVEERHGVSAVVVGSWERGDREISVKKLDMALRWFGYRLAAVPIGPEAVRLPEDMAAELRAIADQIEENRALPPLQDPTASED